MSDSLITPPEIDPNAPATDPANENTPAANEGGNPDPFGDLNEYKDKESGLFLGKYKTAREVFEGYKELSGKVREKSPAAPEKPEDYAFTFADEALKDFKLTMEADPGWKVMAPIFKEANVTQEQAQKIAEGWLQYQLSTMANPTEERKKLGTEADKIIGDVQTYLSKRKSQAMGALATLAGNNAEMLKELHFLIQGVGEQNIPPNLNGRSGKSAAELKQDAFDYKQKHAATIDSNPEQQQIYDGMLKAAVGGK